MRRVVFEILASIVSAKLTFRNSDLGAPHCGHLARLPNSESEMGPYPHRPHCHWALAGGGFGAGVARRRDRRRLAGAGVGGAGVGAFVGAGLERRRLFSERRRLLSERRRFLSEPFPRLRRLAMSSGCFFGGVQGATVKHFVSSSARQRASFGFALNNCFLLR